MLDILFTYHRPLSGTYGEAFLRAGGLLTQEGIHVGCLELSKVATSYFQRESYLEEVTQRTEPKLIVSHSGSLRHSLAAVLGRRVNTESIHVLEEEIESFFIRRYQGKIQTNSSYNPGVGIEFKEGFVRKMRKHKLPHPLSVLQGEVSKEEWNYEALDDRLNSGERKEVILKDITLHRGRGVHAVQGESPLFAQPTIRVAQKRVGSFHATSNSRPYCLRVVTFPGKIVGAFLTYNQKDGLCSNHQEGYVRVVLHPGREIPDYSLRGILPEVGVNPNLTLREDVYDLALRVSRIPSRSLLRGIDILFEEGKPYVVEAQTNPGNPTQDSFPVMAGINSDSSEKNMIITSVVLASCLARVLQQMGQRQTNQKPYKRINPHYLHA